MKIDLNKSMGVLRNKIKVDHLEIQNDVLFFIAKHIEYDRKKLEAALLRVVSYSVLFNKDIDLALATEALSDRIPKSKVRFEKITSISKLVSTYMSRGTTFAAIGGILMLSGCSFSNENSKATLSTVPIAAAEQNTQQDVSLNGYAIPFQEVPIFAPSSGNIREMLVKLGDYVEKGQKLADIDGGDLTYRIKQAQAQVKKGQLETQMNSIQQQISLTQTKVNLSSENPTGDLETAKAKVKELEFALEQAQNNLDRIKNVSDPSTLLDKSTEAKDQLEAQLNKAKQDQQNLTDQIENQKEQIQQQLQQQQQIQQQFQSNALNLPKVNVILDSSLVASLQAAKLKVAELENAFNDAQKNLDNQKQQLAQKVSINQQIAQAEAAKQQAEFQLNSAKQMVDILMARGDKQKQTVEETGQLQQQLDQTTASLASMNVEQAQADLEMLQYQAGNLQLVASISGFISEPKGVNKAKANSSNVTDGGATSTNSPLFVISNLDQVYVSIDAPEAMIGKIKLNQKATVTFPSIGKTVEGKVTYIAQNGDISTMTYPVRVLIDNKDYIIRGGMRAQVTLN